MKQIAFAISLALGANAVNAADLLQNYQLASANDPALRAARATRDANLEAEPIARSQLLPYVAVIGDASYNNRDVRKSNFGSYNDNFASGDAAIQVTQPLYRKDLNIQLEQAKDQVSKADIDYATAEQDLIVRVTQAYFEVLSAQDTLTFTEADVKAIARQLDQAKQRFDVGLIAITDVNEAQARYDAARADAIVAQNNVDNRIEDLLKITNEATTPLAKLKPSVVLKPPQPASLDEWTELALQNNPGVISAKYQAEIAKKQIELQDAGDSPTLDLVGSYGLTRSNADFATDVNDALIGVQLNVPLYTGGGVDALTRQARFQYEAAQELLEERRRAVQAQVRNAYRGVLASISRVKALEATEVSAKSALEATEAGFEVGTRTLVDVLDSQRDLFRARRDLAVSRYDYILNTLSLRQAAGTLSLSDMQAANTWLE
ncbi:MAG: TolC family outer membrane protein [Chromatiaceae bacterium]|jgi:outer membrane protein|nr:TolC family outer membrane protein [Chromatiaceae bacterium]